LTESELDIKLEILANDISLEFLMKENDLEEVDVIKILYLNGLLNLEDHFDE